MGEIKFCPCLVITKEVKAVAIGNGDSVVSCFGKCIKEDCMAYENGKCLKMLYRTVKRKEGFDESYNL